MSNKKDGETGSQAGEVSARSVRGARSADSGGGLSGSQSGAETPSGGGGGVVERVLRAFGAGGNSSLVGGILAQLIGQVDDQLGEAQRQLSEAIECIEWYERSRASAEGRVSRLESQRISLQELLDSLEDGAEE